MFNFKKERLVKDSIGQGSFGEVFPYQKNPQDEKWVVKRTKAKKIEDLLRCLPEIVLGFSCDHPCIVPVKGYSIESKDNKYYIYMKLPRMSGGNLADEMRRRNKKDMYYSESELVKHFYALVSAVDYLHSKKISHNDIKINNILLDDKGNLKLCDIGSGKFIPDEDHYNTMTAASGAINYKAPEIIQHERALREYNLKSQSEKKNQPMENILKREHLYLADSWSLGLTMLEICLLGSKLINPYDPVQVLEENLQKIRNEAGKRYSDVLLKIVFDLLKTDPAQRLKVSDIKTKLEDNFKQILTEDLKAGFGVQKQIKQEAPDISNYLKIFNEKANEIMKVFEDDKREKEIKLNSFEESLDRLQKKLETFNADIEKIKAQKKQEIEEVCKKYEESIRVLKQENVALLEKFEKGHDQIPQVEVEKQIELTKPRDEEAYRKKLQKVSDELNKKWNPALLQKEVEGRKDIIEFKSQPYLSFVTTKRLDDKTLKDITKDMVDECCKEELWEGMDGLELTLGMASIFGNPSISDQGLKEFSSQLGPRLCNVKRLVLKMNNWVRITDDSLKEFTIQIAPRLTNLQHLELYMQHWSEITDKGLEVFISQLAPQLTNVKHLVLDMRDWKKISDEGLHVLASQLLPKLVSVDHLELRMYNWLEITDEGLVAFASHLGPNLGNLKTLKLDLRDWKITSKSLDVLANQISQNLINLQELVLNLKECDSVTESDRKDLRKQLKKVRRVDIES